MRASDQYSDDGDQPFQPRHSVCSRWGRGRPSGQLSLAYIGRSAGHAGGLSLSPPCVRVVAFPLPADPAQPGGAGGEERLWKPVDVNIPSCRLRPGGGALLTLAGMLIRLPPLVVSNTTEALGLIHVGNMIGFSRDWYHQQPHVEPFQAWNSMTSLGFSALLNTPLQPLMKRGSRVGALQARLSSLWTLFSHG